MMFFLFNSFNLCSCLIYKCLDIFSTLYTYNYKLLLINSSYNFINFISKLQIYFNNVNKQIDQLIKQNPVLLEYKNSILSKFKFVVNNIELIKDGVLYTEEKDDYDFVIYSNNNNGDSKLINKIIIYSPKYALNKYYISNIKFVLLELYIEEKTYVINLKNEEFNFYVVGNKFDLSFFEYYVKTILNSDFRINQNGEIYLNIIDHNVNNFNILLYPKEQSIVLGTNNYKIIN